VADERADHGEAVLLDVGLHGVRHVAQPVADHALVDRLEQRLLGDLQQLLGDRGDLADAERPGAVGDPAVLHDADVDRQDVALAQLELAGDPVHDHVVRRRADRAGEAAVALERGRRALRADELLGGGVELARRDARADLAGEQVHRPHVDLAGLGHGVDLRGSLSNDHSFSSNRSMPSVARMRL
jgi:hypothetical protein